MPQSQYVNTLVSVMASLPPKLITVLALSLFGYVGSEVTVQTGPYEAYIRFLTCMLDNIESEDIHEEPLIHCFLDLFCDLTVVNFYLSSSQFIPIELFPLCKFIPEYTRPNVTAARN